MIYYEGIAFTKDECENIKNRNADFERAKLLIKKGNEYEQYINETKRYNTAAYTNAEKGDDVYESLNLVLNKFGYEFTDTAKLDVGVLKYETGNFIFKHNDLPKEGEKRFFCIVGQLNETTAYEGGDFNYWIGDVEYKMKRDIGNVIIFNPSILHEVSMVNSGVRYSLVIWVNYEDIKSFNKPSLI
jgi:predicted 2-oxoglutarate/Fe(II)-dependent dioxygenase YbiX